MKKINTGNDFRFGQPAVTRISHWAISDLKKSVIRIGEGFVAGIKETGEQTMFQISFKDLFLLFRSLLFLLENTCMVTYKVHQVYKSFFYESIKIL